MLATSKTFLFEHLLNKDGDGLTEFSQGNKFTQVMDKFTTLCFPNVRNLVTSFKHHFLHKMYVSNILALKYKNGYEYIQDSCFPRENYGKKMLLFKMFMHGIVSGCDLVKWMQFSRDFQTTWKMFDHVKYVNEWTTLAYHVIDLVYCKMMIITIFDMQLKDMDTQCAMWQKLNKVTVKHGVLHPNFKGFMANGVQTNWNH